MSTKNRPFFRLTKKRTLLLERILSTINVVIGLKDEHSFSRMSIAVLPHLTEEERNQKYKEMDDELEDLYLMKDVLNTVASRKDDDNRTRFSKRKREWKHEWDIPADVFQKVMDDTINLLKSVQATAHPDFRKEREEEINVLKDLNKFYNNHL